MSGAISRLLLTTLACWASAALAQPSLPSLPFEARTEWLLPSGRIAGRSVSVARFESDLRIERAIAETRRLWRRESRFDVLEGSSGQWRTLSRRDGRVTTTLQIQSTDKGGSHGLLSVWFEDNGPNAARSEGAEQRLRALLPEGANAERAFSSLEGGGIAATLVATHEGPPSATWSRLLASIRAAGFEAGRPVALPAHLRDARVATFQRRSDELVVTMDARGGRVGIVMHLIEGKR